MFYGDHAHHAASIARFIQCDRTSANCAAHSRVEVYLTLTRMPGRHRTSSEQAMLFVDSIRERLSSVALDVEKSADALRAAASVGIVGGGIYDAMIARCALKANGDVLYSWNIRHYSLLGSDVTALLRTP